jgi:hypothetical protein
VPWARHAAGHTRAFDDEVCWLVAHSAKSTVCELLRIAWRTVGGIIDRVVTDAKAAHDPFSELRRIGIDEISYKKGHRYLTVVIDHDSGHLVWAGIGRDKATLRGFFDLLGEERSKEIEVVTADGASWIGDVVTERCPNATVCIDAFHVVAWATEALDEVRREVWNDARRAGMRAHAKELKGCRFALWKNPEDLTMNQQAKLSFVARTNSSLYRAYLLKEQLRVAIKTKGDLGLTMLDHWLSWAQRSRIAAFVELARKIRRHLPGIEELRELFCWRSTSPRRRVSSSTVARSAALSARRATFSARSATTSARRSCSSSATRDSAAQRGTNREHLSSTNALVGAVREKYSRCGEGDGAALSAEVDDLVAAERLRQRVSGPECLQLLATPTESTPPAVVGATVVIGDCFGGIQAFSASSGATRWSVRLSSPTQLANVTSPTYGGGNIFVSNGKRLFALDAEKGTIVWSHPEDDGLGNLVFVTDEGNIFAPAAAGPWQAYSTATGLKRPGFRLVIDGAESEAATGSRDVLFFPTVLGVLKAIDASTGRTLWTMSGSALPPVIAGIRDETSSAAVAGSVMVVFVGRSTGAFLELYGLP